MNNLNQEPELPSRARDIFEQVAEIQRRNAILEDQLRKAQDEILTLRAGIDHSQTSVDRLSSERDFYMNRNIEFMNTLNLIMDLIRNEQSADTSGQLRAAGTRLRGGKDPLPSTETSIPKFLTESIDTAVEQLNRSAK